MYLEEGTSRAEYVARELSSIMLFQSSRNIEVNFVIDRRLSSSSHLNRPDCSGKVHKGVFKIPGSYFVKR
jgi:hypothetical protein